MVCLLLCACALTVACDGGDGGEPESYLQQRDDATADQALAALNLEDSKADSSKQNPITLLAPFASRNSALYNLANAPGRYVELAVTTNPAQPFAPVYSWRTHTQGPNPGPYGYNGTLIGYTNEFGVFNLAGTMPFDRSLCGLYSGETFAVGSIQGQRSSPLSFRIVVQPDSGPIAPGCKP